MTRDELLELAALDAFGLLDDYESALFTRSFHHAAAAVQDEVKQIQAAFASEQALLPDVEPSPELREKVLAAVAQAIEAESVELAPLATIGRTVQTRAERQPRMALNMSGQFWRAAAFILTGALAVVSYFALQMQERNDAFTAYMTESIAQEDLEELLGRKFVAEFFGQQVACRTLRPNTGTSPVHAVIGIREGEVLLYAHGLPEKTQFVLRGSDEQGNTYEHTFVSRGLIEGHFMGSAEGLLASASWEIANAETGELLLYSV
jgi:hypothetical protein